MNGVEYAKVKSGHDIGRDIDDQIHIMCPSLLDPHGVAWGVIYMMIMVCAGNPDKIIKIGSTICHDIAEITKKQHINERFRSNLCLYGAMSFQIVGLAVTRSVALRRYEETLHRELHRNGWGVHIDGIAIERSTETYGFESYDLVRACWEREIKKYKVFEIYLRDYADRRMCVIEVEVLHDEYRSEDTISNSGDASKFTSYSDADSESESCEYDSNE